MRWPNWLAHDVVMLNVMQRWLLFYDFLVQGVDISTSARTAPSSRSLGPPSSPPLLLLLPSPLAAAAAARAAVEVTPEVPEKNMVCVVYVVYVRGTKLVVDLVCVGGWREQKLIKS